MTTISREAFEKAFKKMNGSFSYEGAELNMDEKELLFKRLNGQITNEEYNKAFIGGNQS